MIQQKPYNTLRHARFMAQRLKKFNPETAVILILIELGIPSNRDGYDYLRRCILYKYRQPAQFYINKMYIEIGKSYHPKISISSMERSIRILIKNIWAQRDEELWSYYFPVDDYGYVKKPSNTVFVSEIARFMTLVEQCCKEVANNGA